MSFNCVEMSLFISVKASSFCLFSYTFRLRSSFINIFFSCPLPTPLFSLRRNHGTAPCVGCLSGFFRIGLGLRPFPRRPGGGAAYRSRPFSTSLIQSPPVLSTEFLPYFLLVGKKFTKCLSALLPVGNRRRGPPAKLTRRSADLLSNVRGLSSGITPSGPDPRAHIKGKRNAVDAQEKRWQKTWVPFLEKKAYLHPYPLYAPAGGNASQWPLASRDMVLVDSSSSCSVYSK
jgi:hypothetical protein